MFNRSTKMTALLVTAASIISSVPAMAADTTKIFTEDGKIENAVAFKDGKYLYEGYKNDDDDNGVYFNDGKSDSKVGEDMEKFEKFYGDKYAVTEDDNGEEYIVDLTTGKPSTESIASDRKENAANNLKSKLKRTDRYEKIVTVNEENDIKEVPSTKFQNTWYSFEVTTSGGAKSYGFTNESASSYVDAGVDINFYGFVNGDLHRLEEVGKEYKFGSEDTKARVKKVTFKNALAQDDKYVYALVNVDTEIDRTTTSALCIQKVSKAQGSDKDDAYLPKTTETYQLLSENEYKDGDLNDAYKALIKEDGNLRDDLKITAVDGDLYVTFISEGTKEDIEKIKTVKLKLRSSEKLDETDAKKNVIYQGEKVSARVVKKDSDKEEDAQAFDIDVNGNVWRINKGMISKSSKCGDYKDMYKCDDRQLKHLSVYDDKNLIAWNDDAYVTVGGKADPVDPVDPVDPNKDKTDWVQDVEKDQWSYLEKGVKVTNDWRELGGEWYHFDKDGVMETGWKEVNGTWYLFETRSNGYRGAMRTGWIWDDQYNGYFYLNPVSDGTKGAMQTGWYKDTTGTWYYSDSNGKMVANDWRDGYYLGASGAWDPTR